MSKPARSRARPRAHWYPAYVYHVREDITRANMDLYDRQQEQIRSRCDAIRPGWRDLVWPERWEVWKQARHDLGLD